MMWCIQYTLINYERKHFKYGTLLSEQNPTFFLCCTSWIPFSIAPSSFLTIASSCIIVSVIGRGVIDASDRLWRPVVASQNNKRSHPVILFSLQKYKHNFFHNVHFSQSIKRFLKWWTNFFSVLYECSGALIPIASSATKEILILSSTI